jgi:hypothetical protein
MIIGYPCPMEKYLDTFGAVSLIAVLLGAIAMLFARMLWYSPLMFRKSWARHTNLPIGGMRPDTLLKGYIGTFITSLALSYLLAVAATHATAHWSALIGTIGIIWLFIMLEQCNMFIWRRAPFALFLIHTFRSLFCLSVGGAVHYFWSA